MRLEHNFKTSPEPTQTTHLKPNRERFSAAVPSHCPPGYTPTSTFCARSTRTPKNPQPTLTPLEASERNLSNEPKELSSPPAQPKEEPISQTKPNPCHPCGVTVGARPGAASPMCESYD
eukprot:scaffold28221_cov135-Isochrysis_galbana.AAC.1